MKSNTSKKETGSAMIHRGPAAARSAGPKSNGRAPNSAGYTEEFSGFSEGTFEFFEQLYKHNSVTWFRKHRDEYEQFLLNPARSFVVSIGPFIKFINPILDTEPKFNRTLVRINRDMRFAKKPYKDFMLIRFGKSKWDSELFLYIDRNGMELGTFINNEKADGRRRFEENISSYESLFFDACKRYRIGGEFSAYELHYGTEPISESFVPKRDRLKFKGVDHIIFGKEIDKSDPVTSSKKLLAIAMKTFNRLYPLYIFSTSDNPAADLESYTSRIGLLKISSK
ncbi:MAG: DUF2461 domain-containing protein [Bacteroidetes bacterium]|nr:DUF2461 domain-containing protein [Bacteroidota bacterium]